MLIWYRYPTGTQQVLPSSYPHPLQERAKFGSPTLRAAGSMLGHLEPPSGHRPESGSSGTSDLSAPGWGHGSG